MSNITHLLSAQSTLLITPLRRIRKTGIDNPISNLHPHIARGRHRAQSTKQVITATSDNKAGKEVQIVDVLCADRNVNANSADETHDVWEDAGDVGSVATPVEAESEVVWRLASSGVEVCDLEVAFAHEIIVANDDASDGGKEDGIGGEVGGEVVGGGE